MNLYLLTQTEADGYDTYDSCVVVAPDLEAARRTLPARYMSWDEGDISACWASKPENVQVEYLGTAFGELPAGVILASFNAG